MSVKKDNKEIQSRRGFLKKVVKTILPIIGAVTMMVSVVITGCEKDNNNGNGNGNDTDISFTIEASNIIVKSGNLNDIAIVKYLWWDEYQEEEEAYIAASATFKDGNLKFILPATVPDRYLWSFDSWGGATISDPNVKISPSGEVLIAYDKNDESIGQFYDSNMMFCYVNGDVTIKDEHHELYLTKGWNVIYYSGDFGTTIKPAGFKAKWYYNSLD